LLLKNDFGIKHMPFIPICSPNYMASSNYIATPTTKPQSHDEKNLFYHMLILKIVTAMCVKMLI
jgi:hypothetical protein